MSIKGKARLRYAGAIVGLIALGLLSRRVSFIPHGCGDALWAMMVYCGWRMILIRKNPAAAAAAAVVTSFAVEFSQLLKPDWLVRFRSTFIGHMLLGQGFQTSDLLAYCIGVGIIYFVTAFWRGGTANDPLSRSL